MKYLIVSIIIPILVIIKCSEDGNPVKPQNQNPQILSLNVFPKTIGPSDSVIVICDAIDPDGDTLVYDWITDSRVRIKGYNHTWLYHTKEPLHVFYPTQSVNYPCDTLWIQCVTRDVKGGADSRMINFIVKLDSQSDL